MTNYTESTFTAQGLADFYQKVADGKQAQYRPYTKAPWRSQETPNGPSLKCRDDNWRIKPTEVDSAAADAAYAADYAATEAVGAAYAAEAAAWDAWFKVKLEL